MKEPTDKEYNGALIAVVAFLTCVMAMIFKGC